VPPPRWTEFPHTRALVFDSLYDSYRGVIAYARVFSGLIKAGDMMQLMSNGRSPRSRRSASSRRR
jgi:GTP-binding protein LepA